MNKIKKLEFNRANASFWDELAGIHFGSDYYDVEGFYNKNCSLRQIEKDELGDITNKRILHLQCHFGLDSFSLSSLGAAVTGVDFSHKAISIANKLKEHHEREINFVCSSISDLAECNLGQFDIVFASYGAIVWLDDLKSWADTISKHLKPGGFFYIIDEHPFSRIFCNPYKDNTEFSSSILSSYWESEKPIKSTYSYSYAEPDKELKNSVQYIWQHSLSEIINCLIDSGMDICFLHEFGKTFYKMYSDMQQNSDGWWVLKSPKNSLPLMFSLKAKKQLHFGD